MRERERETERERDRERERETYAYQIERKIARQRDNISFFFFPKMIMKRHFVIKPAAVNN